MPSPVANRGNIADPLLPSPPAAGAGAVTAAEETSAKPPKHRLRLPLLATFSAGAMYSMVMPTIWEYMREDLHSDSKPLLGVLLSIYPACQVAGFMLVGRWYPDLGLQPQTDR
jgi:hypothetical protein